MRRPAVALPRLYLVTPQPGDADAPFLRDLEQALERWPRAALLVQFRSRGLAPTRWRRLARQALACCHDHGARLLLGAAGAPARDLDALLDAGADGVHLDSAGLLRRRGREPPAPRLLAASCHDLGQLQQAARLGVDLVTLSPVLATASHPGAATLGWQGLRELCRATSLPVYALGGLQPGDLPQARAAGAQGVAAIRSLWPRQGAQTPGATD